MGGFECCFISVIHMELFWNEMMYRRFISIQCGKGRRYSKDNRIKHDLVNISISNFFIFKIMYNFFPWGSIEYITLYFKYCSL